MPRVLVAGATGYLGSHVVRELKQRGAWIRALVRRASQRAALLSSVDDIVVAQITKPETLVGVCKDVDVVFSSVGLTRQREHFTYEEVDFQGNLNLLSDAMRHQVAHFVYVSIFQGASLRGLAMVDAKERFVDALAASGLRHTIVRPTGFFSDTAAFIAMARHGAVVLFGDGSARINPISGRDLAVACADAILNGGPDIDIGGPEAYSYNAIATMAFQTLHKRARIWHIPEWQVEALVRILRVAPIRIGGPFEFVLTVTRRDMVAPRYGQDRLQEFFEQL